MPLYYSIPLLLASLTLVIGGSAFLSRSLGRLGPQLNIPDQFLGFLTALGADSPEICSAVVSVLSGNTDVGVGIVFGSNLFNLASLLGLTAVIAGRISVRRPAALLDGGIGILVTGVAVALSLGVITAPLAVSLVLILLIPYAALLAARHHSIRRLPLPTSWKSFFVSAATEAQQDEKQLQRAGAEDEAQREANRLNKGKSRRREQASTKILVSYLFGALAAIILGSFGLVRSTTWLTAEWLPKSLLGTLVLAIFTGIPNLYTATRLAQHHRGSSVMTEAMNSNSLNIFVGLTLPSLIFGGVRAHTPGGYLETAWLLLMTVAVVGVLAIGQGLGRRQGMAIIAAYLAFVGLRIYLA